MAASPRSVVGVTAKRAVTPVSCGANRAVSIPTAPSHKSWVRVTSNPGTSSEFSVLVRAAVSQPVRPDCLATSKL
jgi:hypothetical protein